MCALLIRTRRLVLSSSLVAAGTTCLSGVIAAMQDCHVEMEAQVIQYSFWGFMNFAWSQDESLECTNGQQPSCTGVYPELSVGICLFVAGMVRTSRSWPQCSSDAHRACSLAGVDRGGSRRHEPFRAQLPCGTG